MSTLVDSLVDTTTEIDGKWVIAKPLNDPFIWRLKDALKVITGKCGDVHFHKQ